MPRRHCRHETLPCARLEAAPEAASRADAPDAAENEPSATHSRLNSRRFNNFHSLLFALGPLTTPIVMVATAQSRPKYLRSRVAELINCPEPIVFASRVFSFSRAA